MTIVVESFRPVRKGTLRGFARVRFGSGLIVDEIGIHVGSDDGRSWASPPARPMVDKDGAVMRDQKTGKIRYQGLVAFSTANVRNNWSDQIVRAVQAKHPEVTG